VKPTAATFIDGGPHPNPLSRMRARGVLLLSCAHSGSFRGVIRLPSRACLAAFFTAFSALAGTSREVELRAVLISAGDGGVVGHVSQVRARVAPNKARVPSVGILSATASGTDDQWSATLWQAAFVATSATRTSLLDVEFALQVPESLRDRSVGMLTASTLAALLTGEKVLPHTSIIGAINPDGSAGPVEDVLVRLRAASSEGVKRLGVPFGARLQPGADGGMVDVVLEGQRLGVEVKELAGLDDAYLFLTGQALARPAPATESDMELWPAELKGIGRFSEQLRDELDAEQADLEDAGTIKVRVARATKQAGAFEQNGDAVRALVVRSSALTMIRVAALDANLLLALKANDGAAVRALLDEQGKALPLERSELRAVIDEQFPPTSRANDMYAMDVLESIVTQGDATRALNEAATLRAVALTDVTFAARARRVAEALLRGREDLHDGQRFVELYASLPLLKKTVPPLDAERLANSYAAAGAAILSAVPPELAKAIARDPSAEELNGYESLLRTETDQRARLLLTARRDIYATHLVNVYGALGGALNAKGVLDIRNSRALSSQLDYARAQVLRACGRAKREASMVPLAARLRYLNARAAREGSDRQKAEALADLWVAQWWCELAVADGSAR
jgi:hypothetical protein